MIATALVVVAVLGATPDSVDCEAPQTQLAINQCAGLRATKANELLDQVYRRYSQRLEGRQKKKLVEAQRAWLAFRASWCDFIASGVEGGSAHPFVVSNCLAGVTEERVKQLEQVSSCMEGDLACPAP